MSGELGGEIQEGAESNGSPLSLLARAWAAVGWEARARQGMRHTERQGRGLGLGKQRLKKTPKALLPCKLTGTLPPTRSGIGRSQAPANNGRFTLLCEHLGD